MAYVHLKCATSYSIREGMLSIPEVVQAASSYAMPALAITDACNFFGLVKFYKAAIQKGIKPIVAANLYLESSDSQSFTVFSCYCQNNLGYKHLTELISLAHTQGKQIAGNPVVSWEWLVEKQEGLLILSGGMAGDLGEDLLNQDIERAKARLERWTNLFPNRYYLEVQRIGLPREETYIAAALALGVMMQVPVVATHPICFLQAEDYEAHEARVCIFSGEMLQDKRRLRHYTAKQYFYSSEKMQELFSDMPAVLENTLEIAKRCTVFVNLEKNYLPHFPVPGKESLKEYLDEKVHFSLEQYFSEQSIAESEKKAYFSRLAFELSIIHTMAFASYFLIVADIIQWAKNQGIAVGPGRGSGAGSLTAFCLGITRLDPILHGLLFERFLNPERISMPDFDIDFCMERRDEVIHYVAQRYGKHAVAQIITFGTMAAKAVIRDVGRVLGMPYGFVDKVAKWVPFDLGMTLSKALQVEKNLSEAYESNPDVQRLINLAMRLEGTVRNVGKHAGGVVIAPSALTDFTPLFMDPDSGGLVTQFDKDDVEAIGLVKFDFLGLRTLTIIQKTLKIVEKEIDIEKVPLDDSATYKLISSGETTAIFQLESRGMQELIRRLEPENFEEITALVALFRPGPLQSGMVDDYVERKHGRLEVAYIHPKLAPILQPTKGVILYQEQVMEIAQICAGYSLGAADILRRAMGKKKPEEMQKQRSVFLEGALKQGLSEKIAERIFTLIEKFAGYGFNKSHSAVYAWLSYQTAWLKTHYPAQFMASVLSSDMDNTKKVVLFLQECKRLGLVIVAPSVNQSAYSFTVGEQQTIVYGLGAIKGIGKPVAEHIYAEQIRGGAYSNFLDFCLRVDLSKVNKRALEALLYSGALDCFAVERIMLSEEIPKALQFAGQQAQIKASGQKNLLGIESYSSIEVQNAERSKSQKSDALAVEEQYSLLKKEYSVLGHYFSQHPALLFKEELNAVGVTPISRIKVGMKGSIMLGGIISTQRVLITKTGKKMAVCLLEDHTGSIDIVLYSEPYDKFAHVLSKEAVIIVQGNIFQDNYRGGEAGLKVVSAQELSSFRHERVRFIQITIKNNKTLQALFSDFAVQVTPYFSGNCSIIVHYLLDGQDVKLALGRKWRISVEKESVECLYAIFGEKNIALFH